MAIAYGLLLAVVAWFFSFALLSTTAIKLNSAILISILIALILGWIPWLALKSGITSINPDGGSEPGSSKKHISFPDLTWLSGILLTIYALASVLLLSFIFKSTNYSSSIINIIIYSDTLALLVSCYNFAAEKHKSIAAGMLIFCVLSPLLTFLLALMSVPI